MSLYHAFSCSAQGYNHIKNNKECQDASASFADDLFSVAVIADGHGSDNYPRTARGSKFAVEESIEAVKSFVMTLHESNESFDLFDKKDSQLQGLAKNILMRWHDRIDIDMMQNPFSEQELEKVSEKYKERYLSGNSNSKAYGTTLIIVCITKEYWFGLQIGDGKCITISNDSTCNEPIPWDEECQLNITTSLCDSDAIDEFRFYKSSEKPLAIFVGCDGVDDSYSSTKELYNFYRSVLSIFGEQGTSIGESEIQQYLPILSQKGSGDDVSVAGLIKADVSAFSARLIKAVVEYDNAAEERERLVDACKIAGEKIIYVNEALQRSRMAAADAEAKLVRAQDDYEKLQMKKAEADKRFSDASEQLDEAKRLLAEDNGNILSDVENISGDMEEILSVDVMPEIESSEESSRPYQMQENLMVINSEQER